MVLDVLFADPFALIFLLLGLLWGSFANVVILRLPNGESVVYPGSHCRSSGQPIRWYDNIPVLSWILLRGRSRIDGSRISPRYPLVELLMGILFMSCYLCFGLSISLLESLIFCFGLVVVTFIDFDHYILPDIFTLSGIVIGLLGSLLNPARTFTESFIGFFVGGGILLSIAWGYEKLKKQEGMGGGDIKMLGWVGAVLGWKAIPMVILTSSMIGLAGGLFYALKSGKGMQSTLPFGPFIALAALIFLFLYWPLSQDQVLPLLFFDFAQQ